MIQMQISWKLYLKKRNLQKVEFLRDLEMSKDVLRLEYIHLQTLKSVKKGDLKRGTYNLKSPRSSTKKKKWTFKDGNFYKFKNVSVSYDVPNVLLKISTVLGEFVIM